MAGRRVRIQLTQVCSWPASRCTSTSENSTDFLIFLPVIREMHLKRRTHGTELEHVLFLRLQKFDVHFPDARHKFHNNMHFVSVVKQAYIKQCGGLKLKGEWECSGSTNFTVMKASRKNTRLFIRKRTVIATHTGFRLISTCYFSTIWRNVMYTLQTLSPPVKRR